MDENFLREMVKVGHNWRNPVWRGEDGSFVEW
jgi:galactonate dehydratase